MLAGYILNSFLLANLGQLNLIIFEIYFIEIAAKIFYWKYVFL